MDGLQAEGERQGLTGPKDEIEKCGRQSPLMTCGPSGTGVPKMGMPSSDHFSTCIRPWRLGSLSACPSVSGYERQWDTMMYCNPSFETVKLFWPVPDTPSSRLEVNSGSGVVIHE